MRLVIIALLLLPLRSFSCDYSECFEFEHVGNVCQFLCQHSEAHEISEKDLKESMGGLQIVRSNVTDGYTYNPVKGGHVKCLLKRNGIVLAAHITRNGLSGCALIDGLSTESFNKIKGVLSGACVVIKTIKCSNMDQKIKQALE